MDKIEQATKRVRMTELRLQAARYLDNAEAYERQAERPVYNRQDVVCAAKARRMRAEAADAMARADLIEAELEKEVSK
jgi:hypothetical protein